MLTFTLFCSIKNFAACYFTENYVNERNGFDTTKIVTRYSRNYSPDVIQFNASNPNNILYSSNELNILRCILMVAMHLESGRGEGGQSFRSCISFDLEIDRSRLIELCWRNFFPENQTRPFDI